MMSTIGIALVAFVGGVVFGVILGFFWYVWSVATMVSQGHMPKSLENIGFTLLSKYKEG